MMSLHNIEWLSNDSVLVFIMPPSIDNDASSEIHTAIYQNTAVSSQVSMSNFVREDSAAILVSSSR